MKSNKRLRKVIVIASVTILNLGLGQITIKMLSSSSPSDVYMQKYCPGADTIQYIDDLYKGSELKNSNASISKGHMTILK